MTEHTYNAKGQLTQTARTGQAPVTYSYNDWGERVATQIGDRFPQSEETAWVVLDGEPWRETVSAVSNLTWRVRVDAEGERQVATDVRGNQTTVDIADTGAWRVVTTQRPGIATPLMEATLDGLTDTTIEASGAIRTWTYDRYGRPIAETDGRGNTLTRAYDALGRLASLTDEAGATTAFAYDEAGRLAAVTNALGNVTCYEYDLRGNTTYAGGAVYPVAYAYDLFGNRTSMTTYRDETGTGDTTAWAYDEATGAVLSKTYADGRGLAYTHRRPRHRHGLRLQRLRRPRLADLFG